MTTIVVPWDGQRETERAAGVAAGMARRLQAEVLIAMVTSLPERAQPDLDRLAGTLGYAAIRTKAVESDDVTRALGEVIGDVVDPMLCMTTHARGRLGTAVLGSVADALLHEVLRPIVLVGPDCAPEWPSGGERILVCLDSSSTSEAIIRPAAQLAAGLGLELWLVQVFHPLDVESAKAPYRFLDEVAEGIRAEIPNVKVCVAWDRYVPGQILHLAHTLDVSMIAMATHGATGLARLALGSVTMAVAHEARCPVLTIRPAGLRPDDEGDASDEQASPPIHLPPGALIGGGPETEG